MLHTQQLYCQFLVNKYWYVWCNDSFVPQLAKSMDKIFTLPRNAHNPFVHVAGQTHKLISISIEGSETLVLCGDEGCMTKTRISDGRSTKGERFCSQPF